MNSKILYDVCFDLEIPLPSYMVQTINNKESGYKLYKNFSATIAEKYGYDYKIPALLINFTYNITDNYFIIKYCLDTEISKSLKSVKIYSIDSYLETIKELNSYCDLIKKISDAAAKKLKLEDDFI